MAVTDKNLTDRYAAMSPEEYRAALARMGLNNTQAGDLFGITGVSSRRFSAGMQTIQPTLARLVRLIEAQRLNPEQVREWLRPYEVT